MLLSGRSAKPTTPAGRPSKIPQVLMGGLASAHSVQWLRQAHDQRRTLGTIAMSDCPSPAAPRTSGAWPQEGRGAGPDLTSLISQRS